MRSTQNGISVATFTLAVDRRYRDSEGKYQADFLNCVAWRGTADFVGKWFKKGMRVAVNGSIQTRFYEDKNNNKRTATEIICDNVEFCESKTEHRETEPAHMENKFTEVEDPELPF